MVGANGCFSVASWNIADCFIPLFSGQLHENIIFFKYHAFSKHLLKIKDIPGIVSICSEAQGTIGVAW